MKEEFGANLKRIRGEQGLNQPTVAEKLGLGLRQYQRIESGKLYPSVEQILLLNEMFKHDFFSHISGVQYNESDSLLHMSIEQTAASRVILRSLSEILGSQPGKSVTGVTSDLNRVLKDEIENVKLQLQGASSEVK
jgi:transcriptional regulator with XRE-family HTH domain